MGRREFQEMIRQKKVFRSLETEALVALIFTAERVRELSDTLLRKYALSVEQYNVLRILRGAGGDGMRTYDVVERMIHRSPNITRLADKLEKRGLVSRRRSKEDGRVILLRIEPSGVELLGKLDRPVEEIDRSLMSGLGRDELDELVVLLEKLCGPILVRLAGREETGRKEKEEC